MQCAFPRTAAWVTTEGTDMHFGYNPPTGTFEDICRPYSDGRVTESVIKQYLKTLEVNDAVPNKNALQEAKRILEVYGHVLAYSAKCYLEDLIQQSSTRIPDPLPQNKKAATVPSPPKESSQFAMA